MEGRDDYIPPDEKTEVRWMYNNQNQPGFGGMQQSFYHPNQQPYRPQAFTPFPQQMQQPVISGRPVSSREEAQAIPMDYAAGAMYMPDLPHGVIYAKIVNNATGEAPLMAFRLTQEEPKKEAGGYATIEDVEGLRAEIARMKEEIQSAYMGRHAKGGSVE